MKKGPDLKLETFDLTKKFFSKEEDSPFAILSSEIKKLDDPRPLGISGHLRAKNEANTIGLSIETCIDGLDELVITVQPSDDNTYEICQEKLKKYPDKIKLFYYTPEVLPWNNSHCADRTKELNSDNQSIHNYAHYCNYSFVKITYKYCMKIDADQIYFTSKLKEIREAILAADCYAKPKRNIFHKIAGRLCRKFYNILSSKLSMKNFIKLMTIINGRCAYGLCGINLTQQHPGGGGQINSLKCILDYYLPLKSLKASLGLFNIYNGGMDTAIFAPNSSNIYQYLVDHQVEILITAGAAGIRTLGCFWFHFGMPKRKAYCVGKYGEDYISLKDYLDSSKKDLCSRVKIAALYKPDYDHLFGNLKFNFDKDKKYIQNVLAID
ncbi:hypothetical protein [Helicobacter sp. 11S03491-1]|uniref:hypothetical protein n=1 Tax=Helicobacter sp. 11S03491-1 TaxID=1476196 RepID=UPI000BA71015|nr:hypothetical protein [Helicobacter sp. 11S03491-1]PAF42971.1 hypothetical protein BKH45_02565 [Helicobacter sp. 11S03491-1]